MGVLPHGPQILISPAGAGIRENPDKPTKGDGWGAVSTR